MGVSRQPEMGNAIIVSDCLRQFFNWCSSNLCQTGSHTVAEIVFGYSKLGRMTRALPDYILPNEILLFLFKGVSGIYVIVWSSEIKEGNEK